jgi:hypothetical protein
VDVCRHGDALGVLERHDDALLALDVDAREDRLEPGEPRPSVTRLPLVEIARRKCRRVVVGGSPVLARDLPGEPGVVCCRRPRLGAICLLEQEGGAAVVAGRIRAPGGLKALFGRALARAGLRQNQERNQEENGEAGSAKAPRMPLHPSHLTLGVGERQSRSGYDGSKAVYGVSA